MESNRGDPHRQPPPPREGDAPPHYPPGPRPPPPPSSNGARGGGTGAPGGGKDGGGVPTGRAPAAGGVGAESAEGYALGFDRRSLSETIFPMKLYEILCNPDFRDAIAWMPHGRSWKVLEKKDFMEHICQQYFSQTRYESFIRQVNGWGFKRMRREGPDRGSYYHDRFL